MFRLEQTAELYNERPSQYDVAVCQYLYRNKPQKYFDTMFAQRGGIMEIYLKDASGDSRSPINGEIFGLFFCANVNRFGQPFSYSPFGDTRVLVRVEEILRLTPSMYFADFYCMQNNKDVHHVTIVLTKTGSSADEFCRKRLHRLELSSNPFLYNDDGQIWVTSAVFVDVFVTVDLNVKNMIRRGVAEIEYGVETRGLGKTSQGGEKGVKTNNCEYCDIFGSIAIAGSYDVF